MANTIYYNTVEVQALEAQVVEAQVVEAQVPPFTALAQAVPIIMPSPLA